MWLRENSETRQNRGRNNKQNLGMNAIPHKARQANFGEDRLEYLIQCGKVPQGKPKKERVIRKPKDLKLDVGAYGRNIFITTNSKIAEIIEGNSQVTGSYMGGKELRKNGTPNLNRPLVLEMGGEFTHYCEKGERTMKCLYFRKTGTFRSYPHSGQSQHEVFSGICRLLSCSEKVLNRVEQVEKALRGYLRSQNIAEGEVKQKVFTEMRMAIGEDAFEEESDLGEVYTDLSEVEDEQCSEEMEDERWYLGDSENAAGGNEDLQEMFRVEALHGMGYGSRATRQSVTVNIWDEPEEENRIHSMNSFNFPRYARESEQVEQWKYTSEPQVSNTRSRNISEVVKTQPSMTSSDSVEKVVMEVMKRMEQKGNFGTWETKKAKINDPLEYGVGLYDGLPENGKPDIEDEQFCNILKKIGKMYAVDESRLCYTPISQANSFRDLGKQCDRIGRAESNTGLILNEKRLSEEVITTLKKTWIHFNDASTWRTDLTRWYRYVSGIINSYRIPKLELALETVGRIWCKVLEGKKYMHTCSEIDYEFHVLGNEAGITLADRVQIAIQRGSDILATQQLQSNIVNDDGFLDLVRFAWNNYVTAVGETLPDCKYSQFPLLKQRSHMLLSLRLKISTTHLGKTEASISRTRLISSYWVNRWPALRNILDATTGIVKYQECKRMNPNSFELSVWASLLYAIQGLQKMSTPVIVDRNVVFSIALKTLEIRPIDRTLVMTSEMRLMVGKSKDDSGTYFGIENQKVRCESDEDYELDEEETNEYLKLENVGDDWSDVFTNEPLDKSVRLPDKPWRFSAWSKSEYKLVVRFMDDDLKYRCLVCRANNQAVLDKNGMPVRRIKAEFVCTAFLTTGCILAGRCDYNHIKHPVLEKGFKIWVEKCNLQWDNDDVWEKYKQEVRVDADRYPQVAKFADLKFATPEVLKGRAMGHRAGIAECKELPRNLQFSTPRYADAVLTAVTQALRGKRVEYIMDFQPGV